MTLPESLVFWSGAGISADPPTRGPLGRTLTDRALEAFVGSQVKAELSSLYEDLEAPNRAQRPRLETVLEALVQVYGVDVLDDLLSDLRAAVPNRHHEVFARHVRAGGRHITANFDTCIERAGTASSDASVIHIHGSLMDDADTLGARLSVIQGGFPAALEDRLNQILDDPRTSTLAFVGYSGSDFFDATPYLMRALPARPNLQVLWLDFRNQALTPVEAPGTTVAPMLTHLVTLGAALECYTGRLDDFLRMLLPDLRVADAAAAGGATPWAPTSAVSVEQQEAAQLRLYVQIGDRREVLRTLTQRRPMQRQEWEWLAEAQWSAGRYRDALDSWRQAFDSGSDEDHARLVEREAATFWIRGSLLRAQRVCWAAIGRWCNSESRASVDAQSRLLELYGRITTHMRRWPDLRLLVKQSRVDAAAARLAGLEPADLHSRIVTSNARAAMTGVPDPDLASHIETFQESESLIAWLNYLHAGLRARGMPLSRADLALMQARFERLGAHGDAARTVLLPGADAYYSGWDVFRRFDGVDVTALQRLRFAAGVQARRVVGRVR